MIILMLMVKRGVMHEADQKSFFNLCFLCLLLFFFDITWVCLDGLSFKNGSMVNKCVNAAYFAQSGVLCYYWCKYSLFLSSARGRSRFVYKVACAIPMLVVVFMAFASIKTGWFFTIDSSNHYNRGEYLVVHVSLIFLYLLYSFFIAVFTIKKKRAEVNRNKLYAIAALGFMPFFAEIVQIEHPGKSIFCVGATLGLVIVFLEIQKEMISLDPLTRLNNRNQASIYLCTRFKQDIAGKKLYQFAIDLDKFKSINDTYGHMEGDNALIIVSTVLKLVCGPRGHFISRYGGDEFTVFANLPDDAWAEELRLALEEKLAKKSIGLPYTLSMSIGYASLRDGETEESLGRRADEALYEVKKRKRGEA